MSETAPYEGVAVERPTLKGATNRDFRARRFTDVNGANQVYEGCNFSNAIFERAYFKSAQFRNCQFVGARFIDCNFRSAKFLICDLSYVDFERSLVDAREIVATLPEAPNQRRDALQNLSANAQAIGDYGSLGMLTLHEVAAAKEHYRRALFGIGSYYRLPKYASLWPRLRAAGQLVRYSISGFMWGHGEKPFNILLSLGFFLLALSLINFWAVLGHQTWAATGYGVEIVRYVAELFLNLPPNKLFGGFVWVDYAVAVARYLYVGIFVSILFKSISRR